MTVKDSDEESLQTSAAISPSETVEEEKSGKGQGIVDGDQPLKDQDDSEEELPDNSLFDDKDDSSASDNMDHCLGPCKAMTIALDDARMDDARGMALLIQNQLPECEKVISEQYTKFANDFLEEGPPTGPLTWINMHNLHHLNENKEKAPRPPKDDPQCWNPLNDNGVDLEDASTIVLDKWDLCCSQIAKKKETKSKFSGIDGGSDRKRKDECYQLDPETMQRHHLCCGLSPGTLSHLRLPALQELAVNVRLATSDTDSYDIVVQQDGFLRKFDPAAVLWPTAYLLSMCLANPEKCEIPELLEAARTHKGPVVSIELGAGVGLPSIVLGRLLKERGLLKNKQVLATDRALHALHLTMLNSQATEVSVMVAHIQNHGNVSQLIELKRDTHAIGGIGTRHDKGYSILLGSSLQTLFDYTTRDVRHKLWSVLDELLDKSNPNAIAVLAHVVGGVTPPFPPEEGIFERIRMISGNHFGMKTRNGGDSDFAISVFRRVPSTAEEEL